MPFPLPNQRPCWRIPLLRRRLVELEQIGRVQRQVLGMVTQAWACERSGDRNGGQQLWRGSLSQELVTAFPSQHDHQTCVEFSGLQ